MKDTLAQIASTMNYAGFSTATLAHGTPKHAPRSGWFRRGVGGMYVFVTTCVGRGEGLLAELYDANGKCLNRERCDDALRAADAAEQMLHSRLAY